MNRVTRCFGLTALAELVSALPSREPDILPLASGPTTVRELVLCIELRDEVGLAILVFTALPR